MLIILTCTRNQLHDFHNLSTAALFLLGGYYQIFASSLQLCSHDCVLGHTELSIYGKILNDQEQVTCMLVKYGRNNGTSIFIVAPYILIFTQFIHQQMHIY